MQYKTTKGVYVHIPFCVSKCSYCDFTSFAAVESKVRNAYISSLEREVIERSRGEKIETVYFGGGTPSILNEGEIEKVVKVLKDAFHFSNSLEMTIEANPESLSKEKIKHYRDLGFNRISIGIQSLSDRLLRLINRAHDRKTALEALEMVFKSGFKNVSVDLIYALPTQSLEEMVKSYTTLLENYPLTHFSSYSLSLEEGTPLERAVLTGKVEAVSEEEEYEMGEVSDILLKQYGFDHYEISNYAKDGFYSRHNSLYWNMDSYYGFGAGAASFLEGTRYENTDSLEAYLSGKRVKEVIVPDERVLKSEMLFTGLRRKEGVNDLDYRAYFKSSLFDDFKFEIKKLLRDGLLKKKGDSIRLTHRGLELANRVFMEFL